MWKWQSVAFVGALIFGASVPADQRTTSWASGRAPGTMAMTLAARAPRSRPRRSGMIDSMVPSRRFVVFSVSYSRISRFEVHANDLLTLSPNHIPEIRSGREPAYFRTGQEDRWATVAYWAPKGSHPISLSSADSVVKRGGMNMR